MTRFNDPKLGIRQDEDVNSLLLELADSIQALKERVDKLDDGNGIHKPPEDVVRKYMRLPDARQAINHIMSDPFGTVFYFYRRKTLSKEEECVYFKKRARKRR